MKQDLLSRLVEHLKKRVDLGHVSCFMFLFYILCSCDYRECLVVGELPRAMFHVS